MWWCHDIGWGAVICALLWASASLVTLTPNPLGPLHLEAAFLSASPVLAAGAIPSLGGNVEHLCRLRRGWRRPPGQRFRGELLLLAEMDSTRTFELFHGQEKTMHTSPVSSHVVFRQVFLVRPTPCSMCLLYVFEFSQLFIPLWPKLAGTHGGCALETPMATFQDPTPSFSASYPLLFCLVIQVTRFVPFWATTGFVFCIECGCLSSGHFPSQMFCWNRLGQKQWNRATSHKLVYTELTQYWEQLLFPWKVNPYEIWALVDFNYHIHFDS